MNLKYLLYSIILFTLGQTSVWFQTNGQFVFEWIKRNPLLVSLLGVPISYTYIYATRFGGLAFNGSLWPQRFLGFSIGIIIFALLTNVLLGEGINFKTGLSLLLAFLIIVVQVVVK
jgi:hypothetical protein